MQDNNKKKKKKLRLNKKRLFKLIIFLCIIIFCVAYVINLKIKYIEIKGTNYIKDNEIIEIANLKYYPKMITVPGFKLKSDIKKLDLVEDVKISKSLFGKLTINIKEAKPLFINKNNDLVVLSNKKEIENKSFLGLPTLINYVPSDIYDKLIEGLSNIDINVLSFISEIEYSPSKNSNNEIIDNTRFLLRMNDTNTVYMNTINILQLNRYLDICSAIIATQGQKYGILYLDSSTEENYSFESYSEIKKEEENKEEKQEEKKEEKKKDKPTEQ